MHASPEHPERERYWRGHATRLRRRHAIGWWLTAAERWLSGAALLGLVAVLLLRTQELPLAWLLGGLGGLVLGGAAGAFLQARGRRWPEADALVLLEHRLGLRNRLTLAASGQAPWPEPREVPKLHRWQPWRQLGLIAGALALLGVALLLPPKQSSARPAVALTPPAEWRELKNALDQLDATDLIEPEAIESWRARLEALRQQADEAWYSPHSLEATENLQTQLAAAAGELSAEMSAAAGELGNPANSDPGSPENGDRADAWDSLVQDMRQGELGLNEELAEQLEGANQPNAKRDQGMSEEARRQLEKRLREGSEAVAEALQLSPEDLQPYFENPLQPGGEPNPDEEAGETPMILEQPKELYIAERLEELTAEHDEDRALPGDTLSVNLAGTPEENAFTGTGTSRADVQAGAGGNARVPTRARPSEQAVLERYFSSETTDD